jgi:hypothetical protein
MPFNNRNQPRQICRSRALAFCADRPTGEGCAVRAFCVGD